MKKILILENSKEYFVKRRMQMFHKSLAKDLL